MSSTGRDMWEEKLTLRPDGRPLVPAVTRSRQRTSAKRSYTDTLM